MNVLVTGGAGLIGAFLLPRLINLGCNVIVIDDLSRGKKENVPAECRLIVDSAANIMEYAGELKTIDIVFHLASFMFGLGFSEKNHVSLYDNNALISDGLIKFVSKQTNPIRLVFVSSSCVYPDDGDAILTENSQLGEFPEIANLGYGFSKRHMEDRLKIAANTYNFELSIIRPFNVYGERYKWAGDFSQAIPMLVNKVMTADIVEVWGSGEQRRTYVHADDCAELIVRVGFSSQVINLLNIGHEKTITLNELAAKIAILAKRKIEIENVSSKPQGRFIKACSTKNIHYFFPDFDFSVNLDDGLGRMIDWWVGNVKA